jgi:hypothetical protein
LDLDVMGQPLKRYLAAVQVYRKTKPDKVAARQQAFKTLQLWRSFLASHPILMIIAVQYQVIKGHDHLLEKEFGRAENFFNAALAGLKDIKKESDYAVRRSADALRDEIEKYLVSVRREEEMPKGRATAILKKTATLFMAMRESSLEAVEAELP